MAEKLATYSRIIAPEDYNRMITSEHVYISASDRVVRDLIGRYKPSGRVAEVVELGCGPARILGQMASLPSVRVTGVDHDSTFLAYAREHMLGLGVRVEQGDITSWKSGSPVDVFYSQGMHHHVAKGRDLQLYLRNVFGQLAEGGAYVVSDEFLPEYVGEDERRRKAVIWYCHVIAAAKRTGHIALAEEEAKTLLDDLAESAKSDDVKSRAQLASVMSGCDSVDKAARTGDVTRAEQLADAFLAELASKANRQPSGDEAMDLSRGDYKICDSVFRTEVEAAGFRVVDRVTVGPVDVIGGMAVYVLQR